MTHGEAWLIRKENLDFSLNLAKMVATFDKPLPRRMKKDVAMRYYKTKLRKVFGIEDKEVTQKDFLKIDHYYDYHETQRILEKMEKVA